MEGEMTKRKDYGSIEIDKSQLEQSLMDKGKFISYIWNSRNLIPGDPWDDNLIYKIDTTKMIFPEFNPHGHVVPKKKSLLKEIKTRLSHAWYALKGGECE